LIFLISILTFLLSLVFFYVFTYKLIKTPKRKHQLIHEIVGYKKNMIDDATIIDRANILLTYYFIFPRARRTRRAPPAALNPKTVSLI
jgi:hypothetical protein